MDKKEQIYTIPFRDVYEKPRKKRAKLAVSLLKSYVSKHTKINVESIRVSNKLNAHIWSRSIEKPPRKVRVKTIINDEDGRLAYVMLVDEKIEDVKKKKIEAKSKKEDKKEEAKTDAKAQVTDKKDALASKEEDKKSSTTNSKGEKGLKAENNEESSKKSAEKAHVKKESKGKK